MDKGLLHKKATALFCHILAVGNGLDRSSWCVATQHDNKWGFRKEWMIAMYRSRKLPRLDGYDYAQDNDYFITICTHNKQHLFGHRRMLSPWGKIAEDELLAIEKHFDQVSVEKYVVMPNHIHTIFRLNHNDEPGQKDCPSRSTVIGLYKSGVSRRIRKTSPNATVWQKSFYDHIIRNQTDHDAIWTYIDENPAKREQDDYY